MNILRTGAMLVMAAALGACSSSGGNDGTPSAGGTTTTPPPAANLAPTVGGTSNKIVESDATTTTTFTVADAESPFGDLVVSATSSDPTLLAADGIVLGGSGAERTLRVSPTEDRAGRTTVIVTVKDPQGASGTASFVLDVVAAPTSLVALTGDVYGKAAGDAPVSLSGKSFPADSEDPVAFDGLLSAAP